MIRFDWFPWDFLALVINSGRSNFDIRAKINNVTHHQELIQFVSYSDRKIRKLLLINKRWPRTKLKAKRIYICQAHTMAFQSHERLASSSK